MNKVNSTHCITFANKFSTLTHFFKHFRRYHTASIRATSYYLAGEIFIERTRREFTFYKKSWYNLNLLKVLWLLEHNLFMNLSKGSAFLWQTQMQSIEYGPCDRRKKLHLILSSFTVHHHVDMNSMSFCCPKSETKKMNVDRGLCYLT